MKLRFSVSFLTLFSALTMSAQTHVMEVNTKKLGAPVQPTMYGIFFEDINYAPTASSRFVTTVPSSAIPIMYVSPTLVIATSSQVWRMKASSALP